MSTLDLNNLSGKTRGVIVCNDKGGLAIKSGPFASLRVRISTKRSYRKNCNSELATFLQNKYGLGLSENYRERLSSSKPCDLRFVQKVKADLTRDFEVTRNQMIADLTWKGIPSDIVEQFCKNNKDFVEAIAAHSRCVRFKIQNDAVVQYNKNEGYQEQRYSTDIVEKCLSQYKEELILKLITLEPGKYSGQADEQIKQAILEALAKATSGTATLLDLAKSMKLNVDTKSFESDIIGRRIPTTVLSKWKAFSVYAYAGNMVNLNTISEGMNSFAGLGKKSPGFVSNDPALEALFNVISSENLNKLEDVLNRIRNNKPACDAISNVLEKAYGIKVSKDLMINLKDEKGKNFYAAFDPKFASSDHGRSFDEVSLRTVLSNLASDRQQNWTRIAMLLGQLYKITENVKPEEKFSEKQIKEAKYLGQEMDNLLEKLGFVSAKKKAASKEERPLVSKIAHTIYSNENVLNTLSPEDAAVLEDYAPRYRDLGHVKDSPSQNFLSLMREFVDNLISAGKTDSNGAKEVLEFLRDIRAVSS